MSNIIIQNMTEPFAEIVSMIKRTKNSHHGETNYQKKLHDIYEQNALKEE